MIRDLWKLEDSGDEPEAHFAKQFFAIHSDDEPLANRDWLSTVMLCSRGTICPDGPSHTRCCESYAIGILFPVGLEHVMCPWCKKRANGS